MVLHGTKASEKQAELKVQKHRDGKVESLCLCRADARYLSRCREDRGVSPNISTEVLRQHMAVPVHLVSYCARLPCSLEVGLCNGFCIWG